MLENLPEDLKRISNSGATSISIFFDITIFLSFWLTTSFTNFLKFFGIRALTINKLDDILFVLHSHTQISILVSHLNIAKYSSILISKWEKERMSFIFKLSKRGTWITFNCLSLTYYYHLTLHKPSDSKRKFQIQIYGLLEED